MIWSSRGGLTAEPDTAAIARASIVRSSSVIACCVLAVLGEEWKQVWSVGPGMESDGCLVAPAVFKTVVPALCVGRSVRFAPSPPVSPRRIWARVQCNWDTRLNCQAPVSVWGEQ